MEEQFEDYKNKIDKRLDQIDVQLKELERRQGHLREAVRGLVESILIIEKGLTQS